MSAIKRATLPRDERGNDPNDLRDEAGYLERLAMAPRRKAANLSWADRFKVTEEEVNEMADPEFVYPNLIIGGHVVLIVAEPNGGKTTILMHVAGEIAEDYQVIYVNADVSGGDAKLMHQAARAGGFELLLPDMKAGLSMSDVVQHLEETNQEDAELGGVVFIFDTLKKMTDVIHKSKAKSLLKTLRGLSAKGATIVCLAHTNKYADAEGNPIYEGTGDLRADVDELIYLIPTKNPDGSMTVSTKPDKVRGAFEPITFEIAPDRRVSLSSKHIDVAAIRKSKAEREKDHSVIEAITEAIKSGKPKQTEIVQHCKEHYDIGWRTTDKVLRRYKGELWNREKGFAHNAWNYDLIA